MSGPAGRGAFLCSLSSMGAVRGHRMITRYQHSYVLDVMSDDHPGIVAAVSNAVEGLGGNIDSAARRCWAAISRSS